MLKKSHRPQSVDCSYTTYEGALAWMLMKSHQLRCGWWYLFELTFAFAFCRLGMNDPPTAVGGIFV